MVARELVDLARLIHDSSESDPSSFSLGDDRIALRPTRRKREITDIVTWVQAFSIYSLVLVSYYPSRATDLLQY